MFSYALIPATRFESFIIHSMKVACITNSYTAMYMHLFD
uniref:Uncharacterized protein n=1 Tax=Anguilla anguilla TaxID=7936 RepID=A0A0E9T044_ANGAN